jgi:hypothetical protein
VVIIDQKGNEFTRYAGKRRGPAFDLAIRDGHLAGN